MKNNLTEYVLIDNFRAVAGPKNELLELSEDGIHYFPRKSFFKRYVRASVPDKNSWENVSDLPKVGEYLVTTIFFGFSPQVTIYPIKEINQNYKKKRQKRGK